MNYKGYFTGLDCRKYEVRLIDTPSSNAYTEITLAGDQPFVVNYNISETPFEPVRTSTASINIVSDDYMEDLLNPCSQGVRVELADVTTASEKTECIGYLTPKVFDAVYDQCYEQFSLEAADCISSLQYIDYTDINSGGLVTIKDILAQICDSAGLLEGFYWTRSKKVGNAVLLPEQLIISEHNFHANDTDEPWKLNEVLEEICRYLGFTALQWKRRMYFVDYQYLEPNEDLYMTWYAKPGYNAGSAIHMASPYTVTSGSYMSNGASISMEPIYNKVVVNANMYAADYIIPNIFDDNYLTNRVNPDNFYTAFRVPSETPDKASYLHGNNWLGQGMKEEEVGDSKYLYYHRMYDNKYYESVYTNDSGTVLNLSSAITMSSAITKNYRGGTIVDHGSVEYVMTPTSLLRVPNKLDYTRYLCISERHNNEQLGMNAVVFRTKENLQPNVILDDNAFLVFNCHCIFERYLERNYINPEWTDTECTFKWNQPGQINSAISRPKFRLTIGNKGWSSQWNEWVSSTSADNLILPSFEWGEDNRKFWNKEMHILNNVSWEDYVNAEGIKIPLSGIDTTQGISFEVLNPVPGFWCVDGRYKHGYEMNAYCWISDMSLKCMYANQDAEGNESDVIYENVISACSVNELNEIRVRITTFKEGIKPSYSHMGYRASSGSRIGFLKAVTEDALGVTNQKCEQNIIQKYVHQYSTPTKKISLTIPDSVSPLQKLYGVDVDNISKGYVQLGAEIDYGMSRQTITAIEKVK